MKNDNQYEGYEWGEMEGCPSNTNDEKIYHRERKRHYEVVDRGFLVGEDANPKRPLLFPKRREDKEIWILGGPTHVKSNPAWVRHLRGPESILIIRSPYKVIIRLLQLVLHYVLVSIG